MDIRKARSALNRRHGVDTKGGNFLISNQDKWILDADIKGFFNNINHEWLLKELFLHPDLKKVVSQWLKAKIFDNGTYTDPITGTPHPYHLQMTDERYNLSNSGKFYFEWSWKSTHTIFRWQMRESIYPLTKSKEQRMQIKHRDGRYRLSVYPRNVLDMQMISL